MRGATDGWKAGSDWCKREIADGRAEQECDAGKEDWQDSQAGCSGVLDGEGSAAREECTDGLGMTWMASSPGNEAPHTGSSHTVHTFSPATRRLLLPRPPPTTHRPFRVLAFALSSRTPSGPHAQMPTSFQNRPADFFVYHQPGRYMCLHHSITSFAVCK